MIEVKGKYSTAKVMIDDVEESCMSQIVSFVNHPAFANPIAIMPDTHAGKGSVIGFTMKMTDKIVPNVVGVDIGCGMLSTNVGKSLGLELEQFDHKIRQRVPFGVEVHEQAVVHMQKDFPWHQVRVNAEKFARAYFDDFGVRLEVPNYDIDWFMSKCESIGGNVRRFINSIGTLGGGNHFIETGISQSGDHWITLHTGSRNFGKRICEYWQAKAVKRLRVDKKQLLLDKIEEIKKTFAGDDVSREIFKAKKSLGLGEKINLNGCEWLEGNEAAGYLFDMIFAQTYATFNREQIFNIIVKDILHKTPLDTVETVHNFIDFSDFVIRKGAIRSYEGDRMIIPFNMRDGILICRGLSNTEWNCSAPHGAGRLMGRGQAKRTLSIDKFKSDMQGIFSTSVGFDTLDESPDAYKDPAMIEAAIAPTAVVIDKIKPIHSMKDSKGQDD